MIQGLRLFPWITSHRAELIEKGGKDGANWLSCRSCKFPAEVRRYVRCGWLPEKERSKSGQIPLPRLYSPEVPEDIPDVCPGYLAQIPAVVEGARAYSWRERGALREFYDGEKLCSGAKLGIDIIAAEFRTVEQAAMIDIRRKQRNG